MAGCVICSNSLYRSFDRKVRLGYSYDLQEISRHFSELEELPKAPLNKPREGYVVQDVYNPRLHSITVCSQCRFDLVGLIRRWLAKEFIQHPELHLEPKPVDPLACVICDASDQDGRTLRVAQLPGLENISREFSRKHGISHLGTCKECRADFLFVLRQWISGKFIADGRKPRTILQQLSEIDSIRNLVYVAIDNLETNLEVSQFIVEYADYLKNNCPDNADIQRDARNVAVNNILTASMQCSRGTHELWCRKVQRALVHLNADVLIDA